MPAKIHSNYDDEVLCQDLAKSDLSITEIAQKPGICVSMVYMVARGDSRPELKVRIDELIAAEKAAGTRLARSRGRWFVARLIQIASQEGNLDTALKAVLKGLEISGIDVAAETGGDEKKTIELVFSSKGGEDPLARRLTGVVNGNN